MNQDKYCRLSCVWVWEKKNNMSTLKALYVRHMIPKTFLIILSIIWEFSHADLGMYRVIYYFKISELLFKLIGFSLSES